MNRRFHFFDTYYGKSVNTRGYLRICHTKPSTGRPQHLWPRDGIFKHAINLYFFYLWGNDKPHVSNRFFQIAQMTEGCSECHCYNLYCF